MPLVKPTRGLTVILASLLISSVMSIGALAAVRDTTAHMSGVDSYVHITYTAAWKRPAVPKDYIAEVAAGWEKQADAFARQPNGGENARIKRAFVSMLKERVVAQPDVTGTAEYWGTSKCMRWTTSLPFPSFTFNGDYTNMVIKESDFGGAARRDKRPPAEFLRTVLSRSLLDSYVPYLGFTQPGKKLFSAQEDSTQQLSSGCQRTYLTSKANHTLVVTYDNLGRPSLVEEKALGHVEVSTAFYDYAQSEGRFWYPKTVKRTQYRYYGDRTGKNPHCVLDEILEYRAVTIDHKPANREFFDVQHPRAGVSVHDLRPGHGDDPYGTSYHYDKTGLTIDQASSKESELAQSMQDNENTSFLSISLRFLCLAILLYVLGRCVINIRKKS